MIKYYAYYSVGGYKDMYLGNSEMKEDATYFLPLLPVMKKKAEADSSLNTKINELEKLPKIEILSNKNTKGLPDEALSMISHGGYKVMLRNTISGEHILAFREIPCVEKDENGRTIPFMILMVGEDSDHLDVLTTYFISHIKEIERELSKLFYYDPEKNGVAFNIADMNKLVTRIRKSSCPLVLTTDKCMRITLQPGLSYLVIKDGLPITTAIQEQNLQREKVDALYESDIVPLDNKNAVAQAIEKITSNNKSILKRQSTWLITGGSLLAGFILGYFLTR